MKDSINTGKFFLLSTSVDFRNKYHGDISKLSEDFLIDEESKQEIASLDLDKLTTMLEPEDRLVLTPGSLVASHTENSHVSHAKANHDKSSHNDDRAMIENLNWSKLVKNYGDLTNEIDFANSIIERHGGFEGITD